MAFHLAQAFAGQVAPGSLDDLTRRLPHESMQRLASLRQKATQEGVDPKLAIHLAFLENEKALVSGKLTEEGGGLLQVSDQILEQFGGDRETAGLRFFKSLLEETGSAGKALLGYQQGRMGLRNMLGFGGELGPIGKKRLQRSQDLGGVEQDPDLIELFNRKAPKQ
ncbi:hypothetical protein LCGC14_3120840 [marine sediment metagenome]|uniref:Uncharacterized protein n=1 Tax=marine sediment metagenome TaxID=412755 RepID=A0A0F8YS99_9ZZZZ